MTLDRELTEAEQEEEKKAVRKAMDQVVAAYGKRDSEAMAAASHDQFITFGRIARGKAEIAELWSNIFSQWGEQEVNILEDFGIEFLAPNVAVWRARGEFANRTGPDGESLPPQGFVGANVYIKKEGKWRRASAFIMVDPDA